MNTIVNVTGMTLKCLETNENNAIKKQKIKEHKRKYYILNREKNLLKSREWYKKNKEKKLKKSKERYLKNKEIVSKQRKEHYLKNKERAKQESKKWYLKNKERRAKKSKEWVIKNKEKHKQLMKKWFLENKEYIRKKNKERRATDPTFRMVSNIRRRILLALKGKNKSANTMKLLGADIEQVWKHLESTFKPGMTKENHGEWHIDHIIPCISFDLSKPEEQAKCFHYTNLQALWAHENLSKGAKILSPDAPV
jgi:hypothetical protein